MKSLLIRIYAYQFLADFTPIALLYAVMFTDLGLSTFEISFLIGSWSVSSLLAEVPSGVVADKFDRRKVLAVGQLLVGSGFLAWLLFPGFWGYLVGFLIWGTAGAAHSGTFEAFVYDELTARDQENKYPEVLGRTESAYLIGVVAGAAFATGLVQFGYEPLIWASIVSAILAAITAMSMPAAAAREEVEDEKYFSMLKQGFRSVATQAILARVVMLIAIAGCVADLTSEYAPLFATDRSIQPAGIAAIGAIAILVMAATSAIATKLPGNSIPGSLRLAIAGGLLVLATLLPTWPAIIMFNAVAIYGNIINVLARAEMQTHVEKHIRATTTSVAGFSLEVLNFAGLLAIGLLADQLTRTDAFQITGIAIVALSFLAWIKTRPRKKTL